jgi:hypothetical protein
VAIGYPSPNGKIERNALPNPEILLQEFAIAYAPPQNAIEQSLVSIWQTVLELERVGIDHNFFEIGGNSLLITQVYSKLKNQLSDRLETFSIVDLFKYPTIRSLAQYLNQTQETTPENPELIKQIPLRETKTN